MDGRRNHGIHLKLTQETGPLYPCGFLNLFVFFLLVTLFSTPILNAQATSGTIRGRVTDPTGAVVPNTGVVLTRTDTGVALRGNTNNEGTYSFPSLQPGPYALQATHAGFAPTNVTITLAVDQIAQLDLALRAGAVTESVTVDMSSSAQLDTQDSNLNYTVGARQVSSLPLNGRNPYGLAALSPGIMPGDGFGAGLSTARGAVVAAATNNFESNGGIGGSNEILLDGVSIIVCCQGQPPLTPSVETVDQFKVITSTPPAQFGRSSGGLLSIVTKTGTNRLHGDVYEYFRNDQLDAANFFTKKSGVYPIPTRSDFRSPHKFNQFGGFVSGPISIPKIYNGKDKTFFTFGYEGTRNLTSTFATTTVPTELMRRGVFTEAPALIYDPNNIAATGGSYTRQPVPAGCDAANCYSAGRYIAHIDPVAQKILPLIPQPNAPGATNNYNYSYAMVASEDQLSFRLDHNFSPTQRLFVRGIRDTNSYQQNGLFNHPDDLNAWTQPLTGYLFALGDTWTLSPTTLLQFNYGFAYQKNNQIPQNYTGMNASDYGFSSQLVSQQQIPGLPLIFISGMQQLPASPTNLKAWSHYTHSLGVSATLQRHNHAIILGWEGRYIIENNAGLVNPLGSLNYDSTLTNGPNPSAALPSGQSQFDSFAAFLLGAPTTSQLQLQQTLAFTQPYNALFVQDDWRIKPNLTLNLGLRYDIEMGFRERYNRWADFDPSVANPLSSKIGLPFSGGARFLGVGGNSDRAWQTSYKSVSPRLGFSYSASPTTVLRGGFSILFLPTSQRGYGSSTFGFNQNTTIATTLNSTPSNSSSNPFPSGVAPVAGAAAGVQAGIGSTVGALLYNTPVSYQEQWNFGIEQQLSHGLIFSLNYAGGRGVKLPINGHPSDLNPKYFGAPGDTAQVNYLQARVPNPFYGSVATGSLAGAQVQRSQLLSEFPQYISNTAMSNGSLTYQFQGLGSTSFNAMQAGLSYQKSGGLTASVFYTWSKLLGNVSDLTNGFLNATGNPGIQNYYLIKQYERSNLVTDLPHRIVGNAIYSLPFGRGKKFSGDVATWTDLLIGGWQVNTIIAVQSGFPLGLTQTGGQAFSGSRPMYVPGINPLTSGSTHHRLGGLGQTQAYFNPAAFRLSKAFELGNVPRSAALLRSPLIFQDDVSAIKDFKIWEAVNLQFRVEAFNVLNKVQFGPPGTIFGASNFGYITSQSNLPRNVQLALKLSF